MDKGFFNSKNKQKLLYTLSHSPGRYFSVRELSVVNNVSQQAVKKLVSDFAKHRIVNVAEKRGERYYQIDRHSALFSELLRVFGKEKYPQKDIVAKIILSLPELKLAALTGLFVGPNKASVDLLLVGSCGHARVKRAIKAVEQIVGNELNYALMTEKEYRDRLYSFDWFIKEVMEKQPVVLLDKLRQSKHPRKKG